MISADQIEFYRRNGFLQVEDLFSPAKIAALRGVTDDFVEQSRRLARSDATFILEPDHCAESPRVRRLQKVASLHPLYRRALEHPALLDLVGQLIGPSIRYRADKLNLKPPAARSGGPAGAMKWSQGWAYYPHTNDSIAVVGVALDDTTLENGCLQAIPGTHRGPIHDHNRGSAFAGFITDPEFRPEGAVPLQIKAGGVSIHHARVIHGAGPNLSSGPRRVIMYHYCAGDAWPLIGGENYWPIYAGSFLRGEPVREPRMEGLPVRLGIPAPSRMPEPGGFEAGG